MSISKKIRFEIFKRDNFTCQYCGKKSPVVVLELDHIIPKNDNGGDNIENLITSCFDCNRGKGKELLENYKEGTDPTEQAILLLEKERQLMEYSQVLKTIRDRKHKDLKEIENYWFQNAPRYSREFPESIVLYNLDFLPKEKIFSAIDTCRSCHRKQPDKSWEDSIRSFFYGILRKMREE